MKRTTLRTSAIALGVAAALPATAQEWNLGWGGFIHQHVAFGSSEVKRTRSLDNKVFGTGAAARSIKVGIASAVGTGDLDADAQAFTSNNPIAINFDDSGNRNYYITFARNEPPKLSEMVEAYNTFTGTSLPTLATAGEYTIFFVVPEGIVFDDSDTLTKNHQNRRVNDDIKYDGGGMHSNTEVHFTPSVTLDSGLTFGATIEFEGDKEGVDQSFISVSSESLGTLKLGKHGKTGLGVHAPSVGIGINSGDHPNFIAVDTGDGAMSGTNSSIIGTSDRISYTTPKNAFGGFELGISYAPGGDDGNRRSGFLTKSKEKGNLSDNIDVAMKFAQSLGDASFEVGLRYGTAKEEGAKKKPRNFGVGASVGFGGFTFGGSYADVERDSLARSSSGWNLGASYAMDAWTFGIETYQGEADDGDEHSVSKIAASRTLGPGVTWDIYALTASSTNTHRFYFPGFSATQKADDDIGYTRKDKASGNAFGTAIKLKF